MDHAAIADSSAAVCTRVLCIAPVQGIGVSRSGMLCLVFVTLLLSGTVSLAAVDSKVQLLQTPAVFPAGLDFPYGFELPDKGICAPTQDIPIQGLNLTGKELAALETICWQPELAAVDKATRLQATSGRGVPPGVDCKVVQWWAISFCHQLVLLRLCLESLRGVSTKLAGEKPQASACALLIKAVYRCDMDDMCTDVCEKGSVFVEPWLDHAMRMQASQLSVLLPAEPPKRLCCSC